jgi:hypothetical protein
LQPIVGTSCACLQMRSCRSSERFCNVIREFAMARWPLQPPYWLVSYEHLLWVLHVFIKIPLSRYKHMVDISEIPKHRLQEIR